MSPILKSIGRVLARLGVLAHYEAARFRTGRPILRTTYQDARLDIAAATRQKLQEKARYYERNSALINRLADIFECYVVGSGLHVTPETSSEQWNDAARDWWRTWERFCDVASRQSFGTLQGLIARSWFVDGEVFVLLTYGESGQPRLQLIEAHRVSTPIGRQKEEGSTIVDGVEIDPKTGRPVAYHVSSVVAGERSSVIEWKPVPASEIVHVFEPSRPGQYRGIPFFTAALNTLEDLDELKKLEIKAARAAAVVANILVNQSGEADPETLLATGGVVSESSDGTVTAYEEKLGGETIVLRQGEDLKQFQSNRPSVVTREYWRDLQAEVCASAGIPAVLVYPDTMQGTQYRGSLDMAATFFRSRSAVMQEVVRRIYEHAIKSALSQIPVATPRDWYKASIRSPRSVNVDVGRNSAAMIAELAQGATNYEAIYAPQGLDWKEELRKLAEQRAFIESLGLNIGNQQQAQQQ